MLKNDRIYLTVKFYSKFLELLNVESKDLVIQSSKFYFRFRLPLVKIYEFKAHVLGERRSFVVHLTLHVFLSANLGPRLLVKHFQQTRTWQMPDLDLHWNFSLWLSIANARIYLSRRLDHFWVLIASQAFHLNIIIKERQGNPQLLHFEDATTM